MTNVNTNWTGHLDGMLNCEWLKIIVAYAWSNLANRRILFLDSLNYGEQCRCDQVKLIRE